LEARDGELGHIEDFVLEDTSWVLRYFVVDTRNWLPGKRVLIAPSWIEALNWERSVVVTDLPKEVIEQAPPYDPDEIISRDYEVSLFKHYSRTGYWQPNPADN